MTVKSNKRKKVVDVACSKHGMTPKAIKQLKKRGKDQIYISSNNVS
jgi:hypothetical protein